MIAAGQSRATGNREIMSLTMRPQRLLLPLLAVLFVPAAPLFAQGPGSQRQQPEFVRQGQQLMRSGKLDEALALYRGTLKTSPDSVPANEGAGTVLDLMGKGADARTYFQKAIESAGSPAEKAAAQRGMALSWGFAGNCKNAAAYEKKVFDYYVSVKNFYQQGEIADEAARVCIDSGDPQAAAEWYKIGRESGLKQPNIPLARVDLWNFRWEHAQARIAARNGHHAEAEKHVALAKAILDKGTNPEQAQFFPYLEGYVAFYAGDYKTALDDLLKANQNDPFIQCLMAQSYEKLGDKNKALELYRKAASATAHNPPAAYAVPFSKRKLKSLGS